MEITYHGHSCVRLRGREAQVVIDPPDVSLPGLAKQAPDIVVRTDPTATDPAKLRPREGQPQEVTGPGEFELRGVSVLGLRAEGVTLMRVEVDDVRVVSVGRLDRQLDEDQIDALGRVDVLVVPVGGVDALGAEAAGKLVKDVAPAIVVPVRYRAAGIAGSGEYEPVDKFAKEMGLVEGAWQPQPKLNLTGAMGASEETRVVVLEPRG